MAVSHWLSGVVTANTDHVPSHQGAATLRQAIPEAACKISDGTDGDEQELAFWVAVRGGNDAWCRPRLVDKLGPYRPQRDPLLSIQPGA